MLLFIWAQLWIAQLLCAISAGIIAGSLADSNMIGIAATVAVMTYLVQKAMIKL